MSPSRSRRSISRRQFVAGAVAVPLIGGIYGFLVEPRRVVVSHHTMDARNIAARIRMVQISDLHLQHISGHVRRVAQVVNELRPDIIFLTGDMIDRPDRLGELEAFLGLLRPATPKFAILGNWEHWGRVDVARLRAVYSRSQCRLLINESVVHSHPGADILVTGIDDWTGGVPDLGAALQGATPQSLHVLLAHSPGYRDVLIRAWQDAKPDIDWRSISLVLSGHTHGGQIALFGWAPVRPPGSGRYVAGWYREGGPPMYVSRGVGTSVMPIRFGAPPEIAVFDWASGGD